MNQSDIQNEKIKTYQILAEMYSDDFFPNFLVDKCKSILLELCSKIEKETPKNLVELYELTHAATDRFNDMENEFYENNSEIETGARECIAVDFEYIAHAYGFDDADIEELIATREW
ncbi:MAG: DUF5713 family protein [Saprospiraceae bacterium]